MKKFEGPITDENFSLAWKYIDKKIVELKKKNVVSNILKITSNIAFLFSMLMITYGGLRVLEAELKVTALSSVPVFHDVWTLIQPIFFNTSADLMASLPKLILLALSFPFVINVLTFLIIWIAYRPANKEETGDRQLDSKTLLEMSKELKFRKSQERGIGSIFYGFLYMYGVVCFIILMFFKLMATNGFMIIIPFLNVVSPFTMLKAGMGDDVAAGYARYAIFIVIFIYVAYTFLNLILNLLVRFLYKTKVKTFLRNEIEEYCYIKNPLLKEEKDQENEIIRQASGIRLKQSNRETLTEDEQEILKKSSDIIAKRETGNKELAHKNPTFKIIRMSFYVLVLIWMIISVNKVRTMDLQQMYDQLDIPSMTESIPTEEVAPIIEAISEEDLLAIVSEMPEEEFKNIVAGLAVVEELNISEDISKEEFSSKIGNMTLEEATNILNDLTDEDLFHILDGLPKEMINEYLGDNMFNGLYGEPSTEE